MTSQFQPIPQKADLFHDLQQHMMDSQIKPNGVHRAAVIDAFASVNRHDYIHDAARSTQAYVDADIALGGGSKRFLMEPRVLAKLIQAADIKPTDKVLDIATGTGYAASIASYLSQNVFAIESANADLSKAKQLWQQSPQSQNINGILVDDVTAGYAAHAPYQVIIINGSIPAVPHNILSQLEVGGRLITVLNTQSHPHQAVMITRLHETHYDTHGLCDAFISPCVDFEPKESHFSF